MFGPTVSPRFDGSVHGVVVQAIKKASLPSKGGFWDPAIAAKILEIAGCSFAPPLEGLRRRNIATTLVSFTSLYVPGWFNSWLLSPVPAAGE